MRHSIIFLLIFILSGCSHFKDKGDDTEGWDADRLYTEARGELDSGSYSKAVEYYQKLETNFRLEFMLSRHY